MLQRKLVMNPNVKHNINLGADQGFVLRLTKPGTPGILYFIVHKIRLGLTSELLTKLKHIYL